MGRLFTSGFELNNAGTIEWTTIIGTPTVVAYPFSVTSGSYSGRIANLVSGTRSVFSYQFAAADGDGPFYARGDFKYSSGSLPTASNTIMMLTQTTGTIMARLTLESSGSIILRDEDGAIGSSALLTAGQVYRLEMEFNRNAGVNSVVRARIDGTEFAGSATRAISAGIATLRVAGNGNTEAQTVGEWFWDNLAVNDSTGSFQNSYPGAGQVLHLRPNATGDNDAWTGTWADIDEITPNDATDDINSNTLDQLEDVNLDATPAAIGSGDTINLVSVGVRFRISSTTGADPTFVVRIKASSGGTVEESGTIAPTATTWLTNAVAVPKAYPLTLYDLPGASTTAWTKADLDTAQIGVHETLTDTHTVDVTALWLVVDYTTAGGPQTFQQAAAGTLSFDSGALLKATNRLLSADLSFTGQTLKQTFTSPVGSLSFSGLLATTKLFIKALAGALSFASGLLTRQTGKQLTGNLTFTGSLAKAITHKFSGSLNFLGNLAKFVILTTKTGGLSFLGTLSRLPNKLLTGNLFPNYSDNFNRANSTDLGTNWSEDREDWEILSNRVTKVHSGFLRNGKLRWTGNSPGDNQFCQAVILFDANDNASRKGVGVRLNTLGDLDGTGYALEATHFSQFKIARKHGDGTVDLASFGFDPTDGIEYTLRLEAVGSQLSAYIDGIFQQSITDTTYTSGSPGLWWTEAGGSTGGYIDNFVTGDVVGTLQGRVHKGLVGVLSFSGQLLKYIPRTLSGSLSFSGVLQTTKVFLKSVTGTLSFASGLLVRRTGKVESGTLSTSGTLLKRTNKVLGAGLSFSGALVSVKAFLKSVSGSLSFSGVLLKRTSHGQIGTLSFGGTLLRTTLHGLTGNLSFTGGLIRSTGKLLVGVLSFAGELAAQKLTNVFQQAVAGTLTFTGALRRSTSSRGLAGTVTFIGTIVRSTAHRLTGSLSFSGALSALRIILKAVSGVLSFSGALVRFPTKRIAGTLTSSGGLRKSISHAFGGVLSFVGNLLPQLKPFSFVSVIGTVSTAHLAATPDSTLNFSTTTTADWSASDTQSSVSWE